MLDKGAALWYHYDVAGLALRLSIRQTVPWRQTYPKKDMKSLRIRAH